MGNGDNVINCIDNKSERIVLKEGDFKSIKNLDPLNSPIETIFNWDKIDFETKTGYKTSWFLDKGTNKVYTFMSDANSKIISGAVIEYHKNSTKTGILQKDNRDNETAVEEFQGNDIQKEKIKSFIINKVAGSKEELILVSNSVLSEAKKAIANTEIKTGDKYKITGNGLVDGKKQLG